MAELRSLFAQVSTGIAFVDSSDDSFYCCSAKCSTARTIIVEDMPDLLIDLSMVKL